MISPQTYSRCYTGATVSIPTVVYTTSIERLGGPVPITFLTVRVLTNYCSDFMLLGKLQCDGWWRQLLLCGYAGNLGHKILLLNTFVVTYVHLGTAFPASLLMTFLSWHPLHKLFGLGAPVVVWCDSTRSARPCTGSRMAGDGW